MNVEIEACFHYVIVLSNSSMPRSLFLPLSQQVPLLHPPLRHLKEQQQQSGRPLPPASMALRTRPAAAGSGSRRSRHDAKKMSSSIASSSLASVLLWVYRRRMVVRSVPSSCSTQCLRESELIVLKKR